MLFTYFPKELIACPAGQDSVYLELKTSPELTTSLTTFNDFSRPKMASQSILRAGLKSPARTFMKPASRSILKRPAPLPLSPNPLPFAASFSITVNSSHLSPHVHFPDSSSMAATFSAFSPNTYDRAAIVVSPKSASFSSSPWAHRPLSPSAYNAFKLLDPPKRSLGRRAAMTPVPTDGPSLTVPAFEDPRSPKPYKAAGTVSFEGVVVHPPRARGDLGKALSSYPRSPYPSAPIEEDIEEVESRGRSPSRASKIEKPQPPLRARSLEKEPTMKRRQKHLEAPKQQQFLTPVRESPRVIVTKPAPLDLEGDSLSQAFWQSVSLEEPESAYATAQEIPENIKSPGVPNFMFGNKDGSLWSPRVPKRDRGRSLGINLASTLSPSQRKAFSKGLVASPSPNDPFAAFPSFSVAMMNGMDGIITYPPRARVEQK